ncbi:MAG TPA: hypothetical protein VFX49_18910, partial [Chloroflexota bacterium]|nr:hypothetical protein [Chloroflexota bacterium]
ADRRALLERRYYVVIPDDEGADGSRDGEDVTPLGALRRVVGSVSGARRAHPGDGTGVPAAVRRRLGARCDELGRQLGRCGLVSRRLDDLDLARLFYAAWCPELSRAQRIRHCLADYTTLAVRSTFAAPAGREGSSQ